MKLTTILVTRSGSCHVKTLHTVLRNNIQSVQRSDVQSQIVFVNDDPYEKASSIENHMKTSDRILFVDFGIHLDDGSLSTVYNPNETYNVIVFPGVKEGIDWDMFKDKISNDSKEPTYQMGLTFDTEVGAAINGDFYKVESSSARAWMMMCKPVIKNMRCKRTGKLKISPKSDTMFEKFKENGVKVVAYTAASPTFTYPHECVGNIVNSAGVKAN
jgi:hypothetical protein